MWLEEGGGTGRRETEMFETRESPESDDPGSTDVSAGGWGLILLGTGS